MKRFIILLIFLFWNISVFAEEVHLTCDLKFNNGKVVNKSFKLNSRTGSWWNKFTEEEIVWYGTIDRGDGSWGYVKHVVDRYTGSYKVMFLEDSKVKLNKHSRALKQLKTRSIRYGSCKKISRNKLF